MPIVIDEVVLTIEVAPREPRTPKPAQAPEGQDAQALVQEAVERVLEILERKAER
ncbi:MAG: hypothetical protein H6741_21765 [Alphaproteobacteria bacterium]|nr:hypothetical protein [Alphaproteobacteria bacterium]